MSNFSAPTFHPETGEIENACWIDDYFRHHVYGVQFPSDGKVYVAHDCERVLPKAMSEIEKLRDLKRPCECSEDEQCAFARERDVLRAALRAMIDEYDAENERLPAYYQAIEALEK